jgi:hypothetical protein
MMTTTYRTGDAAAHAAWVARQDKHVALLAAQFRPWEIYELDDGRGILVRVTGYKSDGKVDLLDVQYLDPKYEKRVITVTADQVVLWGLPVLDPVDAKETAA